MKRLSLTLFSSLILVTTVIHAKTLTCEIGVLNASSGGLMPANDSIQITTQNLQKRGSLSLDQCTQMQVHEMNLSFCALEDTDAVGIYKAELLIEDIKSKDGLEFTSAGSLLATARKGTKLISLQSDSALTTQFIQKMTAAKMKFPDYKGGDSLAIDEAVQKAFKKGVLTDSDIVALDIHSCKLD